MEIYFIILQYKMLDQHLICYFIGIALIFGSHVYMLAYPSNPIISMEQHAYVNILGAILIAYYFMHKENYIKF